MLNGSAAITFIEQKTNLATQLGDKLSFSSLGCRHNACAISSVSEAVDSPMP